MATGGGRGSSAAECGTLRASASASGRSRSCGSTAGGRHLEHRLQPSDTLQGLALRYGVSTEQIKRTNRLYTNDSIFLAETLRIPVAGKQDLNGAQAGSLPEESPAGWAGDGPAPEITPSEFLRRLDTRITQSKAAALKKLKEDGSGFASSSPSVLAPTPCCPAPTSRRALLGPARLTKTARVTSLRDTEDEIFHL
ncbi:lysM and putative peptidoglycan-binding domain-containing protein 1 [Pristis pectinata]|uniref:lysM and putative peptidoglycan-binding domain-containing protein 1 n=1 Tax=Pristis pectinata TaxID=685728 RepID=UPI00223E55C5|nr:lysM and putative peptidoglycan-binding domain-containing protein 1 [Pristis pectinata]